MILLTVKSHATGLGATELVILLGAALIVFVLGLVVFLGTRRGHSRQTYPDLRGAEMTRLLIATLDPSVLGYLRESNSASRPEARAAGSVPDLLERLQAMAGPPPSEVSRDDVHQRLMISVAQLETRLDGLATDLKRVETTSITSDRVFRVAVSVSFMLVGIITSLITLGWMMTH